MSLQTLFQNAAECKRFEYKARSLGYSNFERRGNFYCHSDLNTLAQGYLLHMEITEKMNSVVDSQAMSLASVMPLPASRVA